MDSQRQNILLQLLSEAQINVVNGQELPKDFARILFPPERKEYELTYFGKESSQSIISQTFAAPIQADRMFGNISGNDWVNKIIFGDNLQVLKTLVDWKKSGQLKNSDGSDGIRVVYIDPPFASKQDFTNKDQRAYSDKMKGAEFLEWLRKRLILLKEVLADNGTIFVHLDWHKAHYIKILLDEIFGEGNFRNELIWHYGTYVGQVKTKFPKKHDSIFMYGKTSNVIFHPQNTGNPKEDANYKRWRRYFNSENQITGAHYPDDDSKFLGYVKKFTKENGRMPKYDKDVILTVNGKLVDSVWEIQSINPMSKERSGYPTQKPEELLERIISSSSNKGDLVLDVFGGSGTTASVSEKLNRRWITGDVGKLAIYTIQKRILQIDNYSPFGVYNAGHYDETKLKSFSSQEWKKFAMALYDVEPISQQIKSFDFEGIKNGGLVKVYSPHDLKSMAINAKITEETLETIYSRVGSSLGSEVFVIAPQGKFGFAVDEYDKDGEWNTVFTILRVPYTLMSRFTESFSVIQQADDSNSVNDAIDAVGFDFIRPPKVVFKVSNGKLTINSFEAESRIKASFTNHGFEALSMLLVDSNYDGKTFNFTNVYFNADFIDQSVDIAGLRRGYKIMLIFIDKFGNEFKTDMEIS
ncbi:DNA methyltransferase [Leuconostoc gelidum]|uniref:DNA methyltransferase n=1 Tax=Leuconostoc gelidum TaxID=1244 RepID=UPI001C7D6050|nr:site-specific DNA-methyltransferase [Leuconostoc gelidum]MBZ6010361.1 site-specific DNA-methyltransferase [Leuconostoc gelidum subsp. aenigmaticum]